MAETKLDIILRLKDQLGADMKRATANIEDFAQSVERAGKEVKKLGAEMTFFGAGITAPFVLALKSVEKFSFGVQTELNKTQNTWLQFNNTIAQAALPTVRQFNEVFAKTVNLFQSIDPVLREHIAHWTLITGGVLTAAGALTFVIGKIIQLAGTLAKITIAVLTWNAALTATIAIVVALVYAFLKFHDQFMLVINALQYAWLQFIDTLMAAWTKFLQMISNVPGANKNALQTQIDQLTIARHNLQQQMQQLASGGNGQWANGINNFGNQVQSVFQNLQSKFQSASGQMTTLMVDMQTRAHELAMTIGDGIGDAFDKALFEGKNFADSMKNLFQQLSRDMVKDFVKTGAKNLINQMFFPGQQTESGSGIGGLLAGMMNGGTPASGVGSLTQQTGQLSTTMAQASSQTANMAASAQKGTGSLSTFMSGLSKTGNGMSVLGASMLSAAIGISLGQAVGGEKGLAGQHGRFGMIGALAGGVLGFMVGGPVGAVIGAGLGGFAGGMFHDGGVIGKPLYAHSGLAPDEIPIIAQTGEGVLNRRAMANIGSEGLRRMNRGMSPGGGGGGVNVYLTQVVQAWDAQDVMRNKKLLSAGMVEELRTNGALRKAVREN